MTRVIWEAFLARALDLSALEQDSRIAFASIGLGKCHYRGIEEDAVAGRTYGEGVLCNVISYCIK